MRYKHTHALGYCVRQQNKSPRRFSFNTKRRELFTASWLKYYAPGGVTSTTIIWVVIMPSFTMDFFVFGPQW